MPQLPWVELAFARLLKEITKKTEKRKGKKEKKFLKKKKKTKNEYFQSIWCCKTFQVDAVRGTPPRPSVRVCGVLFAYYTYIY